MQCSWWNKWDILDVIYSKQSHLMCVGGHASIYTWITTTSEEEKKKKTKTKYRSVTLSIWWRENIHTVHYIKWTNNSVFCTFTNYNETNYWLKHICFHCILPQQTLFYTSYYTNICHLILKWIIFEILSIGVSCMKNLLFFFFCTD